MTVKRSLNELEDAGLIRRVRQGFGEPNEIYVLIPNKGGQSSMNEKLEKLNQEIEKTEARLRRAQHEEKILEHQRKKFTRKERTHRVCTRAAMLESYIPNTEAVTDEQVSLFLKLLFHKDSTRQLMEKVFAGNGTEKEGAE